MNFDYRIKSLEKSIDEKISALKNILQHYKKAKRKTRELLGLCEKSGITKISVGLKTNTIPSSKTWPFGHANNLFAFEPKSNPNCSPQIWRVAGTMGIHSGCGNSDQVQANTENLIDGVYHLKGDKWSKVD